MGQQRLFGEDVADVRAFMAELSEHGLIVVRRDWLNEADALSPEEVERVLGGDE